MESKFIKLRLRKDDIVAVLEKAFIVSVAKDSEYTTVLAKSLKSKFQTENEDVIIFSIPAHFEFEQRKSELQDDAWVVTDRITVDAETFVHSYENSYKE